MKFQTIILISVMLVAIISYSDASGLVDAVEDVKYDSPLSGRAKGVVRRDVRAKGVVRRDVRAKGVVRRDVRAKGVVRRDVRAKGVVRRDVRGDHVSAATA